MGVEAVGNIGAGVPTTASTSQQVDQDRRRAADNVDETSVQKNMVAPEEVLNKIKGLTDGGQHSVRFEMNSDLDKLIISVVDRESGETIRQIPPESLIDSSVYLKELRGSLLDTQS